MTSPEPPAPSAGVFVCPLCGAAVGPADERCRACNMSLAGVGARPQPFSRHSWLRWGAGLLAIYVAVLVIVLLVR
jgi:hypothetical protein